MEGSNDAYREEHKIQSEVTTETRVVNNGLRVKASRGESESPVRRDREDSDSQSGSLKSEPISGWRNEPPRSDNNIVGVNAEVLRKLDEIKEQLARTYNVVDKSKESADQAPMPFFAPGKHVPGPSYIHHYPEPFPYSGLPEMPMHGTYPSAGAPTRVPGHGDPFGFQMHRRSPNWFLGGHQYSYQPTPPPYMPGQFVDIGLDIFEPHPQDSIFHHPTYFPPSLPAPPSRFGDVQYSPTRYNQENIGAFSPHSYNAPRTRATSPFRYSGPQADTRWSSDLNSNMGAPRVASASGVRRCYPLAGGAPFIACQSCFELLQLPKKALLLQEKQQKLQCGACSEVIAFAIINKKLVLTPGHAETKPVSREVDDSSSVAVEKDTNSHLYAHMNRPSTNFSSEDYDNSGIDFHSLDKDPHRVSRESLGMESFHSSSSSGLEDDSGSARSSGRREEIKSVRRPVKDESNPTPPSGKSLQELFEDSTANRAALAYGMATLGFQSDRESWKQNPLKGASLVTETELSFNEYSHTEVSEDSRDDEREDDRPRTGRASGKYDVFVNGHPIPEDLVRKAEKMAGPIQPGNYWYDYRAGFWGVIGKPCLGIILPFIEEFNYPMPDRCAGGNTGVFVNGRELHERDLELLARRGLPTDKNCSYIIDISGRVLDENTGEELDGLGKLAPTVEKVKHGFGMRLPRTAAPSF